MYKLAILDDDHHWCLVVQRFLKQDYDITIHKSVSSFLYEFDNLSQYDVLLIDFVLPTARHEPELDGVEIIARLKRLPFPPIIILVTAYMNKYELEVNSKKMCPEADGFFAKDSGLDLLAQRMKQLLAEGTPGR
ncbi:MAG: response regulator [Leptolyngbyaceae cyanobacterium CSU_1_4]|nr:response regulator [Leptolyngbyaceae cyanobacterium CSU_1_4]